MVSKPLLKELQVIMLEEFNVDLSISQTEAFAIQIIGYFTLLSRISTRNGSKDIPADLLLKQSINLTFNKNEK